MIYMAINDTVDSPTVEIIFNENIAIDIVE